MSKEIDLWKLNNLLHQDRVLVLVNGVPASGKSTLAEKLAKRYPLVLYSLDAYKARLYNKFGFRSNMERLVLRQNAIDKMKSSIWQASNLGISMIVEYPFDTSWERYFREVCYTNHYCLVVINCVQRTAEDILNTVEERYINPDIDREPSLQASKFVDGEILESRWIGRERYMAKLKEHLAHSIYTKIKGDYTVTDTFVYQLLDEYNISATDTSQISYVPSKEEQLDILRNNKLLFLFYTHVKDLVPIEDLSVAVTVTDVSAIVTVIIENCSLNACTRLAQLILPDYNEHDYSIIVWSGFSFNEKSNNIPMKEIFK